MRASQFFLLTASSMSDLILPAMAFTEVEIMTIFWLLHYFFGMEVLLEKAMNGFDTVTVTAQKIQSLFSDFPDDHLCILHCTHLWGMLGSMAKSKTPTSSLCLAHIDMPDVVGDAEMQQETPGGGVFVFLKTLGAMTDSQPKLRSLRVELLRSMEVLDEVYHQVIVFEGSCSPYDMSCLCAQFVCALHKFKLSLQHLREIFCAVYSEIRCK